MTQAWRKPARLEERRAAQVQARQRRQLQRVLVTVLLLAAVGLAGIAMAHPGAAPDLPSAPAGRAVLGAAASSVAWPVEGSGTWQYADRPGETLGGGGGVWRFRVAVEEGLPVDATQFADEVDAILGAVRGWTAGGDHRFQRVAAAEQFDFTVFLATPGTSEAMCATGGVHTNGEASCQMRARQWLAGAPGYAAPLPDYRAYLLNHLVGRQLGYGPEACPGPGQPAPVLLPPGSGLRGCVPNPFPYRGSVRYAGPAIP
jgi:hypothetical protein